MTRLFSKTGNGFHKSSNGLYSASSQHRSARPLALQTRRAGNAGIAEITRLQATIGNRAVAQLMRNSAAGLQHPQLSAVQGKRLIQMMPKFKNENEAILYFEVWDEDSLFTEHAQEVEQLLQLARRQGWEDLQERIEYARSQSETVAIERFQGWDLSDARMLPEAIRLLEMAQNKGWDRLEDLVIRYVRETEDTLDLQLLSDGLSPLQRSFLNQWEDRSPIPMQELKQLVLQRGDTKENLDWLRRLLELPVHTLSVAQYDVIDTYRPDLIGNDPALRRVMAIVSGSPTPKEARQHIETVREYNYDIEFALTAVAGSSEHADRVREQHLEQIREHTGIKKQAVQDSSYKQAFGSLTGKQKKDHGISVKKAEIEKIVNERQQKLSQSNIDEIDEQARQAELEVILSIGPAAYEKRRQEYLTFFQEVHYDPAAIPALELGGQSFQTAKQIIKTVRQAPKMLELIEHGQIKMAIYQRCLKVLGPDKLNAILTQIDCDTLLGFTANESCLKLLQTMHNDQVPVNRIKQLLQSSTLAAYNKPEFAADFSRLLLHYTPIQIEFLMVDVPQGGSTGLEVLLQLQPYAASSGDLGACLKLARRMGWNQAILLQQITALPPGRTAGELTAHMYNQKLSVFERDTRFRLWIHTLGILIEDKGYTVDVGDSFALSGPNTFERICTIKDDTNTVIGNFVAHYHPGAKASAEHPYGSGAHIKPHRGNSATIRLGLFELPDKLKAIIPSKK
ncbi:hypothetical protein [Paenibacillus piri]|uniref:Uncharacterized protein n=1 Tax=Paenibacillus piri TaxID=2547395 RepID=A0A4V2ZTD1_9BACL|nr:hypothetical protein [Paenibacillus piri]TDF96704.1 hypothetical protein E1757_16615 [Paenibacillus piri]